MHTIAFLLDGSPTFEISRKATSNKTHLSIVQDSVPGSLHGSGRAVRRHACRFQLEARELMQYVAWGLSRRGAQGLESPE